MKKYLPSLLLGFVVTSTSFAQNLSDRTIKYSDMKLKCTASDKSASFYMSAKGEISRSQPTEVSWAIYSNKHTDWLIANKKKEGYKTLFDHYNSYTIDHTDAYGYEYSIELEDKVYFNNNKKSKAILTRVHSHPDINTKEKIQLNCTTKVTIKKNALKPITTGRFNRVKAEHKPYVLASIADLDIDSYYYHLNFTPSQEDTYTDYAITGSADTVSNINKVKGISSSQRSFLKKLQLKEENDLKDCIDDRLSYRIDDITEDEREEILENWSICSYELYIVRDSKKAILGFIVDRYNDNGYDEGDGHDGSISTYNSKGKEIGYEQWTP